MAWGVMNRTPGVCIFSAGPGHTSAYTAFTQAHEAGYPLVSISGGYERKAEGQGALQEVDQVKMVDEVSKWAKRTELPKRLSVHASEALRQAKTAPWGHAHITIPRDVLASDIPDDGIQYGRAPSNLSRPGQAGPESDIEAAIAAISNAERPALVVGGGAWFTDAGDQLRTFVERTQIPVFTHEEARGLIPDSHDLCFGSPLFKLNGASRQLQNADCVVLLGATVDWRLDYGKPPTFPDEDEMTLVHVASTPEQIGVNVTPNVGMVADARTVLTQMSRAAAGLNWERPAEWVETLCAANRQFAAKYEDALISSETPIHPGRLCAELKDATGDKTHVVFDGGNIGKWGKFVLPAERPGRWLRLKGPFAAIGYGLPAALAVQLWAPDDDVVLLTGDGSFGYNVMEIETAVRNNLPVTCIIANNGSWGSVDNDRESVATSLPNTAFHKVAEKLGAAGELVTRPDELRDALERGISRRRPYCINVITANPAAPAVFPKTLDGY